MMGMRSFAGCIWMNKMAVCGKRRGEVNAKLPLAFSTAFHWLEIMVAQVCSGTGLPRKRGKPSELFPTIQQIHGSH